MWTERQKLNTTALSDALDRGGIPGQSLGIKPLDFRFRLTGRAFTILYGPAGMPRKRDSLGQHSNDGCASSEPISGEHSASSSSHGMWLALSGILLGMIGAFVYIQSPKSASYPDFQDWRAEATSFEGLAFVSVSGLEERIR